MRSVSGDERLIEIMLHNGQLTYSTVCPDKRIPLHSFSHERKWTFRVAGDSIADLVFLPDESHTVRIAITKAVTVNSFDIQLNLTHFIAKAAHQYKLCFSARADRPRSLNVGFAQNHEPWAGLGWYKRVDLTTGWQSFEETFIVTEDEENARIHFDVGESDGALNCP